MKSVDSEVVAKILETLDELTSSGTLPKIRNSVTDPDDEDQLVFLFLEEELNLRGITELRQLPIGGEKSIVQFANNLPANATLFTILQKLEFTECIPFPSPPNIQHKMSARARRRFTCACPYFTATGYHSLFDSSTFQDSVFDLGELVYPTLIGFALPQHLFCARIGKIYDKFRVFRSPNHYASVRHQELGLPVLSSISVKWQAEPKLGSNIGHKKPYGDIAFTFVREYRQFSLNINPTTVPLQSSFIQKVKELAAEGQASRHEAWVEFFDTFGTHVIISSNGGGRIVVTVLENHLKNYFGVTDLSGLEKEIEQSVSNFLDSEVNQEAIPNWQQRGIGLQGKDLLVSSVRFEGGDTTFATLDLTTCHKPGERKSLISKWSQTLPFSPIMLDSIIGIESITNILEQQGMPQEARQVNLATQRIFGKSFWKPAVFKK